MSSGSTSLPDAVRRRAETLSKIAVPKIAEQHRKSIAAAVRAASARNNRRGVLLAIIEGHKARLRELVEARFKALVEACQFEGVMTSSCAEGILEDLRSVAELAVRVGRHDIDTATSAYGWDGAVTQAVAQFEGMIVEGISEWRPHLEKLAQEEERGRSLRKRVRRLIKGGGSRKGRAPTVPTGVDIAIVTVLPAEFQAVLDALGDVQRDPGTHDQPNLYAWHHARVRDHSGSEYRVVVALSAEPTNTPAALVTRATVERWAPRYVLLVGIAAGIPGKGLELGDVVISKEIWAYEYGKVEKTFTPRHDFVRRVDLGLYRSAVSMADSWRPRQKASRVEDQQEPDPSSRRPKVLHGPVASGDKVIDEINEGFFHAVLQAWPKLVAIEMEGAGAAAAIESLKEAGTVVGFLMIRGISDIPAIESPDRPERPAFMNAKDREEWTAEAATNAARFAADLIASAWPVPPRSVHLGPNLAPEAALATLQPLKARLGLLLRPPGKIEWHLNVEVYVDLVEPATFPFHRAHARVDLGGGLPPVVLEGLMATASSSATATVTADEIVVRSPSKLSLSVRAEAEAPPIATGIAAVSIDVSLKQVGSSVPITASFLAVQSREYSNVWDYPADSDS